MGLWSRLVFRKLLNVSRVPFLSPAQDVLNGRGGELLAVPRSNAFGVERLLDGVRAHPSIVQSSGPGNDGAFSVEFTRWMRAIRIASIYTLPPAPVSFASS